VVGIATIEAEIQSAAAFLLSVSKRGAEKALGAHPIEVHGDGAGGGRRRGSGRGEYLKRGRAMRKMAAARARAQGESLVDLDCQLDVALQGVWRVQLGRKNVKNLVV
jgi:hypothetical protein